MAFTPNREALLALIRPDMKLTKEFLKRIYAFEISYPGFSEQALTALERIGCVRAREHYMAWVREYESKRDAELKEVAHWYRLECEKQWEKRQKGGEEKRRQEIQSLTKGELTELCQKLLQEGVIERPEQFAMAVLRAR